MHGRAAIERIVITALEQIVAERGVTLCQAPSADTTLLGKGTPIDSLGLVNVLLDVEIAVADETGVSIELMSDRAMSQSRSPFRSVGSLTDYILTLLDEAGAAVSTAA
jgi:hypothetical protein